ncbi:hypothetical protein OPQ81_007456 [Rhizoctonia solani]|nr:hypothetical protein OPQ81_007456 [Rhizoctonia solani]
MNEITTSSILAHIGKSSPAQTPISKPSATPVGTEVAELKQSDCSCTCTSCAMEGGFDAGLATKKQCTSRSGCTCTQSKKADSDAESIGIRFMSATLEGDHDSQDPSHSLMPIATADEPKAQDMHSNLQEKLMQKFHQVLENLGMQMLMEVNDVISKDLAYTSQPEEQDPEAWFLSPIVVGAGGGFHLDHPAHCPGNSHTYHDLKATQLKDNPDPHIQPLPDSQGGSPPCIEPLP